MKKLVYLLPFLVFATTIAAQDKYPVHGKKYLRKMHLSGSELYYVSKADYARAYANADKTLNFPYCPVYNRDGKLLKIEGGGGKQFPVFTCFQSFVADLDSFVHEARFYKHVMDTADNTWMKQHVKQVYNTPEQSPAAYNFVLYYPAGMPLMHVRKRYAALVNRIRYYQQQGQDMRICFVVVPLLKK